MFNTLHRLLVPLALLLALAMAALIDYQKASVPMVRAQPKHSVYVLESPRYVVTLQRGEIALALGPWCYGLLTGAQAFASVSEASDFVRLQGLDPQQWQIYQVSGDYQLDVTDGVLNKTLQLVRPLPFNH
jgi:heme O synthase-like polyprenyltransferase